MKAIHILSVVTAVLASASLHAQQSSESGDHASHHPPVAGAPASAPMSEGEVRKVDLAQGKVTLRHGPLVNLDMPPMTMVFTATEPKLLEGLKQGDKIRFTAEKKDGVFLVTAVERTS